MTGETHGVEDPQGTFPNLAISHGSVIWHLHATAWFPGRFECRACTWVCYPRVLWNLLPWPAETPTLGSGYEFLWVPVWVVLEYPRVTCDNPYESDLDLQNIGSHMHRQWRVNYLASFSKKKKKKINLNLEIKKPQLDFTKILVYEFELINQTYLCTEEIEVSY